MQYIKIIILYYIFLLFFWNIINYVHLYTCVAPCTRTAAATYSAAKATKRQALNDIITQLQGQVTSMQNEITKLETAIATNTITLNTQLGPIRETYRARVLAAADAFEAAIKKVRVCKLLLLSNSSWPYFFGGKGPQGSPAGKTSAALGLGAAGTLQHLS